MDLVLAVKTGDCSRLEKLLRSGAKVNIEDENGVSLLHQAVSYGHEKVVKLLLKNGADVLKVTRNKGNTALHIGVVKNNAQIVAALLENVSADKLQKLLDAKTKKTGSTALHVAAKTHRYEIAKILLSNGAMFNARDKEGKQPVCFVKGEVLEVLLQVIAINFSLAEFDEPELCERLIDQSLDYYLCVTNCRDAQGRTLFQIALKKSHLNTVRNLITMRYERSSCFPDTDMVALNQLASSFETHIAARHELWGNIFNLSIDLHGVNHAMNEVRKLLQSLYTYLRKISKPIRILNIRSIKEALELFDRDVDYREFCQANPDVSAIIRPSIAIYTSIVTINCQIFAIKLIAASKRNDLVEVERCLANKADVESRDENNGRTPLHIAAFHGYADLARILFEWHASLTCTDVSGNMPLHIAAANGHVKIVEALLQRNVELIDVKGTSSEFTALHLATGAGCLDVVKCLMKHGANFRILSCSQKMPVNMAKEVEVFRLFALIDILFMMAADGNEKIMNELKKLNKDELVAVTNVRNEMGYNLAQNAIVWSHKIIANRIARLVKNKMGKEKLREEN